MLETLLRPLRPVVPGMAAPSAPRTCICTHDLARECSGGGVTPPGSACCCWCHNNKGKV
jgi:hypothetical protein